MRLPQTTGATFPLEPMVTPLYQLTPAASIVFIRIVPFRLKFTSTVKSPFDSSFTRKRAPFLSVVQSPPARQAGADFSKSDSG